MTSRGDVDVPVPRRVRHDEDVVGRERGRGRDRVVVGALDHVDRRALRLDAGDAGGRGAGGDEDAARAAEEAGHARDGAAVVAVGRGDERDRVAGGDRGAQVVEGRRIGHRAEPVDEQTGDRPRRAEDLERRQPEPARLDLDPERVEPELRRQGRRGDERRDRVPGELAVERARIASAVPGGWHRHPVRVRVDLHGPFGGCHRRSSHDGNRARVDKMLNAREPGPVTEFVVNGTPVEVTGDHPHLLSALREELGVLSAKDGCSPSGQCGCCTVLVDGKAIVSCNLALARVEGTQITTLEGIDAAERDRMAAAFASTGALQCGFCTPGILVRTASLLEKKGAGLDRDTAARHLGAHLCRCTGYVKILDAVELLAKGESPEPVALGGVGTSGTRYQGLDLALGEKDYVDDLRVDGMLHGALHLAAHARADVVAIDTERGGRGRRRRRGVHRRRRPRRAEGRPDPQGLAGVHPGGRPHVLSR